MNLSWFKKNVPVLSVQAGAEEAEKSKERIESITIGAADDAVLAERKRISDINAVASPEQSEMRDKLIADGTPALDAVLALAADAKTRQAKAAAESPAPPPITEKGVAAEMLKMLNSAALPAASTLAQEDQDAKAKLAAIEDPNQAAAFYALHRQEIATSKINFKKEG